MSVSIFSACDGERCAAVESPLDDVDADCILDDADNCPTVANPEQIDADNDDVGASCDTDDSDDTISLVKDMPVTKALTPLTEDDLQIWSGRYTLLESDCANADEILEINPENGGQIVWGSTIENLGILSLRPSLKGLMNSDSSLALATDGELIKIIDLDAIQGICTGYYESRD